VLTNAGVCRVNISKCSHCRGDGDIHVDTNTFNWRI
jgi:hypothetical protein